MFKTNTQKQQTPASSYFSSASTIPNSAKLILAVSFLIAAGFYASFHIGVTGSGLIIIIAAVIGGYMAMNIGANDVANNVGPAVGSKALTMVGALLIAVVFETAGTVLAGGDVVATISKGIIDPAGVSDTYTFMMAMIAALLAAALWLNLATYLSAPISTTHSIVGGVMGAGIAAMTWSAVNWVTLGKIAASWVIYPVLGGVIAAIFLAFIKYKILYKEDKISAAKRWIPILVAIMMSLFSMYLIIKGLKKVWRPELPVVLMTGAIIFASTYGLGKLAVKMGTFNVANRREGVNRLFIIPLICSAAPLSFAHGANDVANAIGPLAVIIHAASAEGIAAKVTIPIWVLGIGALGISAGLMLYGPKVIQIVGEQITTLNPVRAFCVALAAATTVIRRLDLGHAREFDPYCRWRRLRRRPVPRNDYQPAEGPHGDATGRCRRNAFL